MAAWWVTNYHLFGTWKEYILYFSTCMEGTLMKDLHQILSLFLAWKRVHNLEIYVNFPSLKKFTLVEIIMNLESYMLFLSSYIIMWLVFDTHSRPSQVVIILPRIKWPPGSGLRGWTVNVVGMFTWRVAFVCLSWEFVGVVCSIGPCCSVS